MNSTSNLKTALEAGRIIANLFGLKGVERTSSINNFAYQITGVNAMEKLGFSCKVENKIKIQVPKRLLQDPLPQ